MILKKSSAVCLGASRVERIKTNGSEIAIQYSSNEDKALDEINDFTITYRLAILEACIEAKFIQLRDECIMEAKLDDELVWNTYIEDITHGEGLASAIDIVEEMCQGVVSKLSDFEVKILSLWADGMAEEWDDAELEQREVDRGYFVEAISKEVLSRVYEVADYDYEHTFEKTEDFIKAERFINRLLDEFKQTFGDLEGLSTCVSLWIESLKCLPRVERQIDHGIELALRNDTSVRVYFNQDELNVRIKEAETEEEEEPVSFSYTAYSAPQTDEELEGELNYDPKELVSGAVAFTIHAYGEREAVSWQATPPPIELPAADGEQFRLF